VGETTLNEYIDETAIKILRCNKVEDAMNLAEEIVNDTKRGATKAIRAETVATRRLPLEFYKDVSAILDAMIKSIPFHAK